MKRLAAAILFMMTMANGAAASTLGSHDFLVQWIFGNNRDAVYNAGANGVYTAGPGIETTYFGLVNVDLQGSRIEVSTNANLSFNGFFPYNGIKISDVNGTINSFTNLVNLSDPALNSGVTFTEDAIYLNFAAVGFIPAGTTFTFEVAVVPLPASSLMLLAALAILALVQYRRKKPLL